MRISWEQLLQVLWPAQQVTKLPSIQPTPYTHNNCVYLLPYQHTATRTAIKATKYQGDRQAAKLLAAVLDQYIATIEGAYTILPMPVSRARWRERGYNHIAVLLKYSRYRQHVNTHLLRKTIHTKQQTQVTKQARVRQQAGTFSCSPAACRKLTPTVILLDDVVTTGSTMQAARTALMDHLPPDTKLICLAIAH